MKERVIQEHHISYDPVVTVNVYKGEHQILSKIAWYERKSVSKGFITALKVWIALNEGRAQELKK